MKNNILYYLEIFIIIALIVMSFFDYCENKKVYEFLYNEKALMKYYEVYQKYGKYKKMTFEEFKTIHFMNSTHIDSSQIYVPLFIEQCD